MLKPVLLAFVLLAGSSESLPNPVSVSSTPRTNVVFTGGDYTGWQQWDWTAFDVLGFWHAPSDDVRAKAAQHGVRLFEDSHLPDPKTWSDKDARKKWIKGLVQTATDKKLNGFFFDYEGHLKGSQKSDYTTLAQETSAALKSVNASIFICVGGTPTYEIRDFDYKGLAEASEFLFIMSYDMHFWDDYTCIAKGTCSPAEAPMKTVKNGVSGYLDSTSKDKLVLGLPWYGQRYTKVLGVPFNEGQIGYSDVLGVLDGDRVKGKPQLDSTAESWVIKCDGACSDDHKGGEIWYDDATTLTKKYQVARDAGLRGVGCWQATYLPTEAKHATQARDIWTAFRGSPAPPTPPAPPGPPERRRRRRRKDDELGASTPATKEDTWLIQTDGSSVAGERSSQCDIPTGLQCASKVATCVSQCKQGVPACLACLGDDYATCCPCIKKVDPNISCGGPAPPGPSPPTPPGPSPPPGPPAPSDCHTCVADGDGTACLPKCQTCGSPCTSCINGGGGKACATRCCASSADSPWPRK